MLNIIPITTTAMPQFIHNFIIFNEHVSIVSYAAACYALIFKSGAHLVSYNCFCLQNWYARVCDINVGLQNMI